MSTPIKILHFRGHLHKGADSKPEILIFGGKSWGMGQFIFLDLPCASRRGWPGLVEAGFYVSGLHAKMGEKNQNTEEKVSKELVSRG